MILFDPKNREEWLKCRMKGIGGSDAGAILGLNKYKTNVELWREKAGIKKNEFRGNAATEYGKSAEEYIRNLFMLDHPEYTLEYHEYRMHANDTYQFIYATLDGELTEKSGRKGVLEIKTSTINNPMQWKEWDDKIPDCYYCQILHQLVATKFDFVWLRAYIRYYKNNELRVMIKEYYFEKKDVIEDIMELVQAEIKFWDSLQRREEPALVLPEI